MFEGLSEHLLEVSTLKKIVFMEEATTTADEDQFMCFDSLIKFANELIKKILSCLNPYAQRLHHKI